MKLNTYKTGVGVQLGSVNSVTYPSCTLNWSFKQEYEPSTWVHLLEIPSNFSYDEALLLCKHSEDEWAAWIPDHGEIVLNESQFCYAS